MNNKPVIQVFALGGTIAMTPGASAGVTPTLSARDLISAVPGLEDMAALRAETVVQKGSANLTMAMMADLMERVAQSDADAVIVTQGTDSMEETSFLASLLNQSDKPVVFTGAMRTPNQPGADGPANLYDAVLAATDSRLRGVSLVMNGELHDPWFVAKEHTSSLQAFQSEPGPIATIAEGELHWRRDCPVRNVGLSATGQFAPVALISAVLDDDGRMLDLVADAGYKGVVIEAYGAGHLSEVWADKAEALAKGMPVILSTRARGGKIFERSYGYRGAEIDLLSRGLVPAGWLRARKARLLLSALLGQGVTNWKQTFTRVVKSG
ncbi:asparaginase [Kordiimonas lipolytica]|uniref:Asparaginase n=1 Tax=Kordiimonas lipolytica TaxID=1662421 RepID=A0ABV8UC10_9PROT|nr:asparaginase [Kordiimonas lipolytica]